MRRLTRVSALLLAIALLSGCAAGRAFRRGEARARVGDWDAAVTYYQQAIQRKPNDPDYKIALERATLAASRVHFDTARQLEIKDQLDGALIEYQKTVQYDPGNRQAADKVVALEKTIRDRIEASRPRPQSAQIREQARIQAAQPELNPASREPVRAHFNQASLKDILTFISTTTGISVIYDASFQDKQFTIDMVGTLEQVLNTILTANQMFFAVQDDHTIIIAADTNANRLKFERQLIVTFPISYADVTELVTMITNTTRLTTAAIVPVITPNKTANSITIRATQPMMDVIRQLIITNDKPRAEVTLDVEILEVNRGRAKQVGLNLSAYQISGIFSPDQAPPGAAGATAAAASGGTENRPFNLNTISQGVSTADFYMALPQAFVRFLETDTRTKVLLKTQLRGAEGQQLTLNIGAKEPYLTTTYSPIASGGANVNPLSSYTFEQVGISVQATPRVTDEGDILMPLALKNSALGPTRSVGGSPAPSFTNREVTTNLRLRDGESHLLAGLLQDDERRTLRGLPGLMSVAYVKSLFSDTDSNIQQTDIVMLLTPRIIRTHEYTTQDLAPIYVGTNNAFGLTGPPPLIAPPPEEPAQAVPAAPAGIPPQGLPVPTVPQGGAPGQVTTPTLQAPGPAPTTLQPPAPAQPGAATPPAPQASAVGPLGEPQINAAAPQTPPSTTTALRPPTAQVSLTAPTGDVRVAGGPYLVPVFVNGASRMSTVTLTVNFNPSVLRVRMIQEGSFLRQGAAQVASTNKVDGAVGRVDLTFVRTGDSVGASGSGLLSGIMFDAVGTGTSQMTISGVATDPSGATLPLQFTPVSIVVR